MFNSTPVYIRRIIKSQLRLSGQRMCFNNTLKKSIWLFKYALKYTYFIVRNLIIRCRVSDKKTKLRWMTTQVTLNKIMIPWHGQRDVCCFENDFSNFSVIKEFTLFYKLCQKFLQNSPLVWACKLPQPRCWHRSATPSQPGHRCRRCECDITVQFQSSTRAVIFNKGAAPVQSAPLLERKV